MLLIILTFIVGAFLAFFATQNTSNVTINYLGFSWSSIPLYMVVLGSILIGLIFAGVINMINSFTHSFTLMGKDRKIKEDSREMTTMKNRIEELEKENTSLKSTHL